MNQLRKPLLKTEQVAKWLGFSTRTITNWANKHLESGGKIIATAKHDECDTRNEEIAPVEPACCRHGMDVFRRTTGFLASQGAIILRKRSLELLLDCPA